MSENEDQYTDAPTETVTFTWNDQQWEVVKDPNEWPFTAAEAMERGNGVTFIRILLGPDQMKRFADGNRTRARDAGALMRAVIEAVGGKSAGES